MLVKRTWGTEDSWHFALNYFSSFEAFKAARNKDHNRKNAVELVQTIDRKMERRERGGGGERERRQELEKSKKRRKESEREGERKESAGERRDISYVLIKLARNRATTRSISWIFYEGYHKRATAPRTPFSPLLAILPLHFIYPSLTPATRVISASFWSRSSKIQDARRSFCICIGKNFSKVRRQHSRKQKVNNLGNYRENSFTDRKWKRLCLTCYDWSNVYWRKSRGNGWRMCNSVVHNLLVYKTLRLYHLYNKVKLSQLQMRENGIEHTVLTKHLTGWAKNFFSTYFFLLIKRNWFY